MSDAPDEPWGFIVTPTLHLTTWRGDKPGPRCGDRRVIDIADAIRLQWTLGRRELPLFGQAGDRPVCRHCIAHARREAALLTYDADQSERWNADR